MIKLKRLIITLISLSFVLPLTNVYAIESNTGVRGGSEEVVVNTYLIMDKDTLVPEFTIPFEITGISETIEANGTQEEVIAPESNQIPRVNDAKFKPIDYQNNALTDATGHPITLEDNQAFILRYTTVNFSRVSFTKPGNYRYILKQQSVTYDGLTTDSEHEYYIDVIVTSDESGVLSISEYTIKPKSIGTQVDVGEENKLEYAYFVDYYNTNSLEFTTDVSGNQVDHTNTYDYQVLITSADTNKSYKYIVTKEDNSTVTGYLDSGVANTITVKEHENVKIYGLSENDTYSITAEDKTKNGYETSYTPITFIDGVEHGGEATKSFNATGTLTNNTHIDYLYTKNISAKTGVVISILPYLFMVILGVISIRYINKKKIN